MQMLPEKVQRHLLQCAGNILISGISINAGPHSQSGIFILRYVLLSTLSAVKLGDVVIDLGLFHEPTILFLQSLGV